jgi:hypothetical protein
LNSSTRALTVALVVLGLAFPAAAGSGLVAPCTPVVHNDVLPVWMRGGFQGPNPRIPYVVGAHGAIAGIMFGAPLNAPPAERKNNKILWVPRHTAKHVAALWIRMQQMHGSRERRCAGAPDRRDGAGAVDRRRAVRGLLARDAHLVRPARHARPAIRRT